MNICPNCKTILKQISTETDWQDFTFREYQHFKCPKCSKNYVTTFYYICSEIDELKEVK